jgi:polygalacturonase
MASCCNRLLLRPSVLPPLLVALLLLSAADTGNAAGCSWRQQSVFSLDRYGASGDGERDDTPALKAAWNAACASPRPAVVLVPAGKRYLLKPVGLRGPCRSSVVVTVQGTLVASPNVADWSDADRRHWIVFRGVDRLTVNGGGAVDGNGDKWWPHSCKINKALVSFFPFFLISYIYIQIFCRRCCRKNGNVLMFLRVFFPQPCNEAPTALSFHYCASLRVDDLKIINSQQMQMSVEDCTNVQLTRLTITAPGTSPNTDGIHITRSRDVQVTYCRIMTGNSSSRLEDMLFSF